MPGRKRGAAPERTRASGSQSPEPHPTEFRGKNARGSIRPADERYLEDGQLDELDKYVLEHTGPDAQQLVAKRQALRVLLEQLDDEQLEQFDPRIGDEDSLTRVQLLDRLEASATEMPRATYRELLDEIQSAIDQAKEQEA